MELGRLDISIIIKEAIEKHGATREALIPILSDVNQFYGYIPPEAFVEVKRQIQEPADNVYISESQLYSIASFYHMLSTKPVGKHVVKFCESAPCHVMGGREVFLALKGELDLEPGETTPDKKWTFVTTSCLGVCGVGPVLLVDEDVYGNVMPDQIPEILAKYR
jgi:NADH-quinone oxidoreductase subunit E